MAIRIQGFATTLLFLAFCVALTSALASDNPGQTSAIDFNRQIRPILSDNCFLCHGPDEKERKAKLRLDIKEGAFGKLRGGGRAIVPGQPAESVVLERILAEDASEHMPPARTNKKLTTAQVDLLKEWIRQGAPWSEHWSFVVPKRVPLPQVALQGWARNAIDRFILARLERDNLRPVSEAPRTTLIRRVTFDLTGLPPTPADVDTFLADESPGAYEKVVDRLLASPHYGERMAVEWLDAARFADTHGYHIDAGRDMTRWRDYVIEAFKSDLPFDRFTVEQLAGDLLPKATVAQKVASGFNRNHMINFEGGAIPEEYHNAYVVDRVNTTSTVWLGLTAACAQCHDHKYDPLSQKEYYQLYAFFNHVAEKGLDGAKGNAAPVLKLPSAAQKETLAKLENQLKEVEKKFASADVKGQDAFKKEKQKLRQALDELEKQIASTMVMQEMAEPSETFLLIRGEYDKKGPKVMPGLPAALPPLPRDAPPNRLGLARWLVDGNNPLTARVIVNRYWQMLFGTGLVKTAEDFGSQGEQPSHPELLDWLASEFMSPQDGKRRMNWSVRHLIRLMVTSAAYRQTSKTTPDILARDPENRLLARGPRFRLQAEFIRDQALAVSELLNREIGGASVSPYQPKGLWQELAARTDSKNWSAQFFVQSHGKDLYRRSMYTFWKRTSPPPQLVTFDAPDRETCTVRRSRTNTPLQALVLMNDPTYVEASRKLAERLLNQARTADERLILGFRLVTARTPTEPELGVLRSVLEKQLKKFERDQKAALQVLSVGEAARDERFSPSELAAWTIVANVLLNLDETVMRG